MLDDEDLYEQAWGDSIQVSETDEIKYQIADLEAEKAELQAQVAELEEDINYQNRLYNLGKIFSQPHKRNQTLLSSPQIQSN